MPETLSPPPLPAPSLLIAVTGGPGSGKGRLLANLAATQAARGQRVDGVLAPAGPRPHPPTGAGDCWLRLVGSDQELLWAVCDESRTPPCRFEPETEKKLELWAERLRNQRPVQLLVLDEFGRFEEQGRGLMARWPTLAAAGPQIVVVSVRAGLEPAIERVLGRRFDLRIAATDPDAAEKLRRACEDFGEWTRIGLFGGASGGLEMTVGTALHAAKVPLGGLAMASMQCGMMVFAGSGLAEPGRVVWVPFISGGLKAMSPGGSRVRAMVAIVVQGLLFGGTVQALGWNGPALGLGGALVGAWAALQSLLLQDLLLGPDLITAYDAVVLWLAEHGHVSAPGLPWLAGAWALVHAGVAAGATLTAWRLRQPPAVLQPLLAGTGAPRARPAARARPGWRHLREFGQWQFWLPLLLVTLILLGGGSSWATIAWLALRFVAVGCVMVALVSLVRPARWAEQMRRRGWWGPALAFSGALQRHRADHPARLP